jgi:hypothetical protein
VSDTPRDQEPDAAASNRPPRLGWPESAAESIEPVTAPPADPAAPADSASNSSPTSPAAPDGSTPGDSAPDPSTPGGSRSTWPGPAQARRPRWRTAFSAASVPDPESAEGQRLRRRRRYFITGIAVAAAIVVIALCAGALSIVAAVNGARDRAEGARQTRQLRDAACLELERRLNRLTPPGATTTPPARATAVQSENAAVRIYVGETRSQRDQDAWRQLLDARTTYAEGLTQQAKTRTPAFYVAPRTGDGHALADELAQWSPASCAGAIHRLAAPDL